MEAVRGRPKKAIEIATAAHFFADQKGVAIEFGANNHGEKYIEDAKIKLSSSEIKEAIEIGRNYSLKDVLDIVNSDLGKSKRVDYNNSDHAFIEKLQLAIDANLSDATFGVNQLYAAVSMSQMQVYRKLKTLTNQTPSQFIRSYRLLKGNELLKLTDKTIAEIAYEVGFTDPNYFSKVFKKEFAKTPRAYRG
jgi:AraC-like DNA-binding protein